MNPGRHGPAAEFDSIAMNADDKPGEFVNAQDGVYEDVRAELGAGRKTTHWMWFIFPQLKGLGSSFMAQKFALGSLDEARRYLQHPVLGARLRECTRLMLAVPRPDATAILGSPDDLKFRSSMTLFALAAPEEPVFQAALDRFFRGERDARTIRLLSQPEQS